jgi:2-dehydropantoate 2-reductase
MAMKICIFGAGAIGGYMAVELSLAGYEVSAIARGAHLEAMRRDGLKLITEGRERTARFPVSDTSRAFGPQDYVICTLKAHQAHANAQKFAPFLGPNSAVLAAMNGIPWWYFYKEGGRSIKPSSACEGNRSRQPKRL